MLFPPFWAKGKAILPALGPFPFSGETLSHSHSANHLQKNHSDDWTRLRSELPYFENGRESVLQSLQGEAGIRYYGWADRSPSMSQMWQEGFSAGKRQVWFFQLQVTKTRAVGLARREWNRQSKASQSHQDRGRAFLLLARIFELQQKEAESVWKFRSLSL